MTRRKRDALVSRCVIVAIVAGSLGSYFLHPITAVGWLADIVGRAYLHFVAGSMAHEGTHGHLGKSRTANLWWGRLALLPTTVPYTTFRLTHLAHHAHTNVPGEDPDAYLHAPLVQLPLRILLMPHQWVRYLVRHGQFGVRQWAEYLVTYVIYGVVYGTIGHFVGYERFVAGLLGSALLHSALLWYFFAIKTHEGYATGDADGRSHEYLGAFWYWFSFGLSVHRMHHRRPGLTWLQLGEHVQAATWRQTLALTRDVRA